MLYLCVLCENFVTSVVKTKEQLFDMLEPIQTRSAGMDPGGLKKDFGKEICFYGGVDIQQILNNGTIQQISDAVKRPYRNNGQRLGIYYWTRP